MKNALRQRFAHAPTALLLLAALWSSGAGAEPRVVATAVIGPFTGVEAPLHPDNLEPVPAHYYGTDLGFTYVHQGTLHFLFGDTMVEETGLRIWDDTGLPLDDIYATVPLSEWPDPRLIGPDNIPRIRIGQISGSATLDAIDPAFAFDGLKTPEAGWSDGQREYAVLLLSKPRGCSEDAHCPAGFSCDTGLGFIGSHPAQEKELTLGCIDGAPGCNPDPLLGRDGLTVPGSGLCIDRTSSVFDGTTGGRFSAVAMGQRIGLRDVDAPARYSRLADWLTTKFVNTAARSVADFDPAHGPGHAKHDYRTVDDAGTSRKVLLWGRPGFIGVGAKGRPLNLYFAYADMPHAPQFPWQLHYYTGTDANGVPQFGTAEAAAAALDLDSSQAGVQPDEVNDVIQHMSIVWIDDLKKWIMFYGGSMDVMPKPAIGLLECGFLQVFMQSDCKAVRLGNGAIWMRSADDPWGPWSPPVVVIEGGDPYVPNSGQYGPGGMLFHPACVGETCAPHSPIAGFHDTGYGWFYGANIIEPWITPTGDGVDVLWNASTWDPYRVVLLRTHIKR
jgi:Cys-rich repeat protein